MNALIINGSPKGENSNTMNLTRAFLQGASLSGAEIISVCKKEIRPCSGCYSCWTKTPGKCIIRDDMSEILEKLIAADVIIWSFPLYYFSVPGGLKNLIDRQLPLNLPVMNDYNESGSHPNRYDFTRQCRVIISTCGFWTAQGNYNAVRFMFDRYYGADNYAEIFCGQGELFSLPEHKNRADAYLEIVCRAGGEYLNGGIDAQTLKELAVPIYPKDEFERLANASWEKL